MSRQGIRADRKGRVGVVCQWLFVCLLCGWSLYAKILQNIYKKKNNVRFILPVQKSSDDETATPVIFQDPVKIRISSTYAPISEKMNPHLVPVGSRKNTNGKVECPRYGLQHEVVCPREPLGRGAVRGALLYRVPVGREGQGGHVHGSPIKA